MIFSSRFSTKTLVMLCQSFRVGLSAGLSLVDVFRQQARKGPFESRPVIERIAERLKSGDSLEDALKDERRYFPPLFMGIVSVGEQTGNLAEIFRELGDYYREMLTLRRQFLTDISWPVIEFVLAIGALTLFIIVLGWLPINEGGKDRFDPLGFGTGMLGAVRFLGSIAIAIGGIWALYILATRGLGQKATIHRFLLSVPAVGPCWQALCLSRLCMGMHLTLDSSLSAPRALRLSLAATGNGAYEACSDKIATAVKRGDEVSEAFGQCTVFPEEFVTYVSTGEESGSLPEAMGHLAKQYQEEASMKMKILTRILGICVWGMVAILIIVCIIRLASTYLGLLDRAGSEDLSQPLF